MLPRIGDAQTLLKQWLLTNVSRQGMKLAIYFFGKELRGMFLRTTDKMKFMRTVVKSAGMMSAAKVTVKTTKTITTKTTKTTV
ncbi:hypothetical protein PsAD2_01133 [Pseudovibrio axinellae]|uniref:Uncharacterized protein n=1 Tax=Pseudovibrio axinellae TaxID=989403 RepID=A0A166A5P8_9HYPH|nr:hypothetical protein [Pseudovibrio axinellae]KZL20647.1 hypothetical protein PsAD2_01133 [Pseudovibrio axinellae]